MSRSATHFIFFVALSFLFLTIKSAFAESTGNTRTRMAKFGDDLAAAWTDFPKDTQKTVREQKILDLNTSFTRDANAMEVPPTVTIQKALDYYIENVNKTRTILKLDKMQPERLTYVTACAAVLRREVTQASDFKTIRTTQQCFQLMLDNLVNARDTLHAVPNELRQPAYQAINGAIVDLFRNAVPPEKSDPAVQMDANIKAARAKFPTTSPDLEATNRILFTMMESAAKTLEQQAMRGK